MKILSTSWFFFQNNTQEKGVARDGCRIMISKICEYLGRKEESYLFVGSGATSEMKYGNAFLLDNRKYLPSYVRTKDNIIEWQEALKMIFREYLLRLKPDYVFVHDGGEFSLNCMEICEELGQPFSYVNHLFLGRKKSFGDDKDFAWEDLLYSHLSWKTIAVGAGLKKRILETYPNYSEKMIYVIPNGTTYKGELVDSNVEKEYGLERKKVLVCVGSLQPRKNQLQLITAFLQLPLSYRKQIVILICGQDSKIQPMKKQLYNAIKSNNLEKNIFYLGERDEQGLKTVYTRADGLIMPSLSEGLSLVATEMLSYGKPVIMFSDNETAEDINDGNAVVFANDHSDQALADAIIEWYERDWDEDYIKEYSKYYSMERVADDYINYCKRERGL